jgi:hypothetical protein
MNTLLPDVERPSAPSINEESVGAYLRARFGSSVQLRGLTLLGGATAAEVKRYGYGIPMRVDFEHAGRRRVAVLETVTPGGFGHEHLADRAQSLLWSHRAFNTLPGHVRSLDVGGVRRNGALVSVADIDEFFILNDYVEGQGYNHDLERLRDSGELCDEDVARVDALSDYLVRIHAMHGPDPALYVRRIRELVGHNECILGILDSFPACVDGIDGDQLQAIERACVGWRWRLKRFTHRLRQVHGDFHPWNVLFQDGARFVALDRSRGEWGEPADDVAALAMNFVFFSLQRSGRLEGGFQTLFMRFWHRYLEDARDGELPAVAAPFFAFRALVMASPVWYPRLPGQTRRQLIHFVRTVLDEPVFEPALINSYLGGAR